MKSVIGKCGTLIEYYTCYKSSENSTLRLHCSLSFPYFFLNCNHTYPNVWSLYKCDMFEKYTSLNEDLTGKTINKEEKHPSQVLEVTANYLFFLPSSLQKRVSIFRASVSFSLSLFLSLSISLNIYHSSLGLPRLLSPCKRERERQGKRIWCLPNASSSRKILMNRTSPRQNCENSQYPSLFFVLSPNPPTAWCLSGLQQHPPSALRALDLALHLPRDCMECFCVPHTG